MRSLRLLALAVLIAGNSGARAAQPGQNPATANATSPTQASPTQPGQAQTSRAHQVLDATIQALGGPAWLNLRTVRETDRTAAFYQGNPTGVVVAAARMTALPDKQRIDFGRKGRDVLLYLGRQGWEITYKGKKPVPQAQLDEYLRWRDHSLGVVLRQWYRDPATTLLYRGQTQVERHLADTVSLIAGDHTAVTLQVDAEDHRPLRLSFAWRDPEFHDENLDAVEYGNYQSVQGIATPDTITWQHNGQTVRQRYVLHVVYNAPLADGVFDAGRIAAQVR